ncbi:uncharacterized protein si:dkey-229e3.2 [Colossoma macropomum]|uniref:uncharacterized protein si:dkey-229e3.2 n=1 Tax=Colossoma macropomum TaxID=42526 RepID=UPI001864D0F6|nr:uncharacterized protein si:dkey-229e3.2 [Colossoma macropomum]
MSECAVLDSLSEDGFHSCEGFADWSTYSPIHWNEDQGDSSNFGDWNSFHGSLSKKAESPPLSPQERSSDHKQKMENGDSVSPWFVFHGCFHVEETVKDTAVMEIPSLSKLLHNSTHIALDSAALSREAASLCHRLLYKPEYLSLSGPKPSLHSHKQLINTLQLKHSDINTSQNTNLPDQGFEEPESSPAALIQTKLMAPIRCQNKPGYLYQISPQWLNQYSLRLLPHQNKQDLLQ